MERTEQHCQRRASWQAPGPRAPFLEGHRQVPQCHAASWYVAPSNAFIVMSSVLLELLYATGLGVITTIDEVTSPPAPRFKAPKK